MLSSNIRMITFFTNYGTTIFGLLLAAGLLLILVAFFGVIISQSKVNSTKFEKRGLNFFFLTLLQRWRNKNLEQAPIGILLFFVSRSQTLISKSAFPSKQISLCFVCFSLGPLLSISRFVSRSISVRLIQRLNKISKLSLIICFVYRKQPVLTSMFSGCI